uniref:Apolipoprotein D n=1 Tax=Oncorhynchus kisutch TaxID=8019 RepID=A0A8C7G1Y5_ONCKI
MQALQVLSLTLLSVLAANAQTFRPGKCPQPPVQANFDTARYLGKWYEIQKLPAIFQKGECSTATYSLKSPGVVGVLNRESNNTVNAITGYAKVKDPSEPAKLEVTFFEDSSPGPYWVLSTDYEGHSVVYSCTEFLGAFHVDFAWILSREFNPKDQGVFTMPRKEGHLLVDGCLTNHVIRCMDSFGVQ